MPAELYFTLEASETSVSGTYVKRMNFYLDTIGVSYNDLIEV